LSARATALRKRSLALAGLVLLGAAGGTQAHDARPLSVVIVEQSEGLYRVVVRIPPTVDAADEPRIAWPEQCKIRDESPLRTEVGGTSLMACRDGLQGKTIGIEYPVYNPSITTLIRLEAASGVVETAVLPPEERSWTVPEGPNALAVARDYLVAGFRHIWGGPDHLLFVAGLMLLARRARRILLAVTGFTAAHSLTLSLATLGIVHVPIPPVEAMIALSVLFLAGEVARRRSDTFSHRYPIALSFTFGLLHGFGFASALGEVGLPTGELATGLLFFNLGVEAGQLTFIGGATIVVVGWTRLRRVLDPAHSPRVDEWVRIVGAYGLGIPAALWFLQRAALAFGA
jgi:hydrogenase/urease accessory protein HupE